MSTVLVNKNADALSRQFEVNNDHDDTCFVSQISVYEDSMSFLPVDLQFNVNEGASDLWSSRVQSKIYNHISVFPSHFSEQLSDLQKNDADIKQFLKYFTTYQVP